MKFRYLTKVTATHYTQSERKINSLLFANNFSLKFLEIPLWISSIVQSAFRNCLEIESLECDPKWLPLFPNPANVKRVCVPKGVTCITKDSFKNYDNLEELSLPMSLSSENCEEGCFDNLALGVFIGDPTFLHKIPKCNLVILKIPNFVIEIAEKSCENCINLKEVIFLKSSELRSIKSRAFANCPLLRSVAIPEKVESIAPDAFEGCNKDFAPIFHNEAQKSSMVGKLVIPTEVREIAESLKSYINLESLDIHLGVRSCASHILRSFTKLKTIRCHPKWFNSFDTNNITTIIIPDTVFELRKADFEHLHHLKHVEIPDTVTEAEDGLFDQCPELNSIKCSLHHLIYFNKGQIHVIILNEEVNNLDSTDFNDFVNLESIRIPSSIENLNATQFLNCKKLMIIHHPQGETLIHNSTRIEDGVTEIHRTISVAGPTCKN